ncbi:MAG: adenylosuccinate synthetase [Euryarchaeota archaeon]|nr:adenylosuccinate synthetase [Euryarchaeota archaeon]
MSCTVVVDGFYGDTGKGKIVSFLSIVDKPAIVTRTGGPNAGHSIEYGGKRYKLRIIPSAFIYEKAQLLLAPGALVNLKIFFEEMEITNTKGRVWLDKQTGIIESKHIEEEKTSSHLMGKIGSTGSGCGAAQADRVYRKLKLAKDFPELKEHITDVPLKMAEALDKGDVVIVEGTQGTYLSFYHGSYPWCTSKDVTASGVCSEAGIGPTEVDDVILVLKSFVTRVGEGPLEGELSPEEALKRGWAEIATVTGRARRAAPFNYELAKRAVILNGATQIALTKIDILYPECFGATKYEQLSSGAKKFIESIENKLKIPVTIIGTGPNTLHSIDLRKEKIYQS